MTSLRASAVTLDAFDGATAALVRLSAQITAGSDEAVRRALADCTVALVPSRWIEELVLQSYLFAGFPRALNAAREWRRSETRAGAERSGAAPTSRRPAVIEAGGARRDGYADLYEWRERGEETCATVYGVNYEKLRQNIRTLHPALDEWMIVEGYGKVLSRPGLDLGRRELCIVASCVAGGQDRQLHSHLLGAVNAGVGKQVVAAALDALSGIVVADHLIRAGLLWGRLA
jgi:4-carboxymuconolactone decarboxylase